MKRYRLLLPIICAAGFALIALAQNNNIPASLQKLLNAHYAINTFYVDSVNDDKLVEDAIRGILDKLDPHSQYSTAQETKELNEPLQGSFSGVGIQFNMKQDTLYVIQTVAGGPSERVGVLAGDRIVEVNDTVIAGKKMKNTDIMKRLRGPKGTKVEIKVKRHGTPELLTFRITREDIPLYSVDAAYMIDGKTGYVRITRFAESTHREMMQALDSLKANCGMKQIILDLSDNGGGYLNSAIDMVNEFLDKNQMIVYTEGRNSPRNDARADGSGKYRKEKLVVIVNQTSASASEIFSGAIQDWDRGVVVGRRTFGKGLVQRPLQFADGSMIRLTIARYYTPSGRCIQKPYEMGDKASYAMDIYNRYKDGELAHADSIHFADSLKVYTLRSHRAIYGGGGIMPDVFVPIDTASYSNYHRDIVAKGILNQYVIDYVDKHRSSLVAEYSTISDFDARFDSKPLMQGLIDAATNDSIKFSEEQYNRSREVMEMQVKALIARDCFKDPAAYYHVMNHSNELLKAAIDVINDEQRYKSIIEKGAENGRK